MSTKQIYLEKNTLQFSYIGHHWHVLRADMESLWEKMVTDASPLDGEKDLQKASDNNITQSHGSNSTQEKDERLPYWAELWPSSLALAQWLKTNESQIKEKNCLDLGCGLGFTALCGARLGAHVTGVDYEADAIALAKENAIANAFQLSDSKRPSALQNSVSHNSAPQNSASHNSTSQNSTSQNISHHSNSINFEVMDWRQPHIEQHSLDFIWAADIVYERSFIQPILDFLEYALKDTGKVWIAEPGRSIFDLFPPALEKRPLIMKKIHSQETMPITANIPKAHVNIWEITRSL